MNQLTLESAVMSFHGAFVPARPNAPIDDVHTTSIENEYTRAETGISDGIPTSRVVTAITSKLS